ncbi:hypothetical protein C2857_006611 [Epichloe festucae Fl1]|uniref:Uncharacterized protein n=1 Tax=Epichloe festucae (strain Fl1) TaxID=877507 RepID=A0A7S9KQI3_EPIFF|nr:hypothetical protein C2857_006611 [Epichloe festucae Fl1]
MPETTKDRNAMAMMANGRALHDDLLNEIQKHGDELKALPDVTNLYHPRFEMEKDTPALRPCERPEVLMMEYPQNDYVFIKVFNARFQNDQGIYQKYEHSSGKTILCMDNDARRDQLGSERQYFSDLLAISYHAVVTGYESEMV